MIILKLSVTEINQQSTMTYLKIISEFDKDTEELTRKWEVLIDIPILKQIFKHYPDDPDLIMVYPINKTQSKKLLKYQNFEFDFERYDYIIGTYQ